MNRIVLTSRAHATFERQRGLVVVELAIVLPLIILIMFATAELGRALFQYSTLTKAVEAGARYYASAVQDPFTDPAVALSRTRNLVVYASPASSGDAVLPGFGTGDVAVGGLVDDHISVSADYDFQPIIGKLPIINRVIGNNLTMTATQTMRAL
jgi:hypothetical protein